MNRNVTALILLVLAVGVYFTYTSGQIATLEAIQSQNNQYVTAIADANKLVAIRDSVNTAYNNISAEDRARLDKMVPDNIDNVRLMIDVSGIASRHGLTASGIVTSADNSASTASTAGQPGTPTGMAPGLSTVTVSFQVTTSYENFISFLQDVERSLRILDVTHITLTPASTGGDLYTYGVTLDTYWLNQ